MRGKSRFWHVMVIILLLGGTFLIWNHFQVRRFYENTDDSYEGLCHAVEYQKPVMVRGLEVITQNVGSADACIEILGKWQQKNVTEEMLYEMDDGKAVSTIGNAYKKELNRYFTEYTAEKCENLKNSQLLFKLYDSLRAGVPVIAVLSEKGEKSERYHTHFVLVTGMDMGEERITVVDPYGYEDTYSFQEFISAARYENSKKTSIGMALGLEMGIISKNTIYVMKKKAVC